MQANAVLAPAADRTLVAMSGGVDSAVAALLVTREGAQAVGVTLELWSDQENDGEASCCSAQAVRGAREVAHGLGMAHLSIDLRAEFRAGVVDPWLSDHEAGETPNPCVRCNGNVRLDAMLELAERLGARTLVTGHYARVINGPPASVLRMRKTRARIKATCWRRLRRIRLPACGFRWVRCARRRCASWRRRLGSRSPPSANSQDLCFLAGTRQGAFLQRHGGLRESGPGKIVDRQREGCSAPTRGAHLFTVGQRHGLGIGGRRPAVRARRQTRARARSRSVRARS